MFLLSSSISLFLISVNFNVVLNLFLSPKYFSIVLLLIFFKYRAYLFVNIPLAYNRSAAINNNY